MNKLETRSGNNDAPNTIYLSSRAGDTNQSRSPLLEDRLNQSSENLRCPVCDSFVKYFTCPIICSAQNWLYNCKNPRFYLDVEDTSKTLKFQSVLNVDKCFKVRDDIV